MEKKYIIFISIILLAFLSFSQVSASDNGTFTDLSDDIDSSTKEFDVKKDYIYNENSDENYVNGVIVKDNLTINGNNHKIDGSKLARGFNISGEKVVIKNLSFINCNAKDFGGAIYSNSSIIVLENVKFINNHVISDFYIETQSLANSSSGGGAIFINKTNLELINCSFINNYVNASHYINQTPDKEDMDHIMGTYINGEFNIRGGAIYALGGNINIRDSKFNSNFVNCSIYHSKNIRDISPYGPGGGSLYSNETRINILNSQFNNNTVTINCDVFPRIAGGIFYFGKGGCIFVENNNITVINCNFTNNTNDYPGGAIYAGEYANISNSTFINNLGGIGGGIYSRNTTTIYGCTFIENIAVGGSTLYHKGSAAFSEGDLIIINTKLINNAKYEIGANGNITLINTTYKFMTYIFAEDLIKYYNTNKNLVITLIEESGKYLANQKITIKIGKTNYVKTTNKNGEVKLNLNLVPSRYTAKITFNPTNLYEKSSTTVKITIKKAHVKLNSKNRNYKLKSTKKITAQLKDNRGKNLKGKLISFTVAGKKYKAYTKSNGIATVNVKINKKGKFRVNIQYGGDKYYNKIKKTIKLTVK